MSPTPEKRLENYTEKNPQEVLLVTLDIEGEEDQVTIFKGFSSSLMRPTAYDPEVPVIPENATIVSIDRMASPYEPNNPRYIQRGLTWEAMESLLSQAGF
ncbi:hypothetical protein [Geitlerinema sp. PCC 9228]|jgi:hypothetical protein|uniref:DUF7734 family protein n=1 Tax=Geitlerinema sp. PCC 9228 TaxID=111611 RepID=UPI0008F98FB2|nr:hypothetical protein [Geitlerinema sp. PCC 9228]